jgi:hypothetical protein
MFVEDWKINRSVYWEAMVINRKIVQYGLLENIYLN